MECSGKHTYRKERGPKKIVTMNSTHLKARRDKEEHNGTDGDEDEDEEEEKEDEEKETDTEVKRRPQKRTEQPTMDKEYRGHPVRWGLLEGRNHIDTGDYHADACQQRRPPSS